MRFQQHLPKNEKLPGKLLPQFLGDAVHVDRQADPAIADQRDPELLLPHRSPSAALALQWQLRSTNVLFIE